MAMVRNRSGRSGRKGTLMMIIEKFIVNLRRFSASADITDNCITKKYSRT